MCPSPVQTFAGFGFGPIGAGLFVLEALRSGNFGRIVIGEVMPRVVASVRGAGGKFGLNVAHLESIESLRAGPIEIEDPAVEEDHRRLVEAVARASEVATAVPSIRFYRSEGPGSIHRILAEGLERREGRPVIIYAAENHNRAAEALEDAVMGAVDPVRRDRVRAGTRFLNTVIGKMSAVIADPERVSRTGLLPLTPGDPRAFLVESFNRILISSVRFPREAAFRRGIEVFEEKDDLLPFEEAKLYGHNAVHALAAYLAALRGLVQIDELRKVPGGPELVREALLEESGAALIRKWKGVDPLFTAAGFRAHADDLLVRIFNPCLGDLVERVARDPGRKLARDDRLVGTMRLALREGILPRRFALGAAAALIHFHPPLREEGASPAAALEAIWQEEAGAASHEFPEKADVLRLVSEALPPLRMWLRGGPLPSIAATPP